LKQNRAFSPSMLKDADFEQVSHFTIFV
jgi:hypothetical protein